MESKLSKLATFMLQKYDNTIKNDTSLIETAKVNIANDSGRAKENSDKENSAKENADEEDSDSEEDSSYIGSDGIDIHVEFDTRISLIDGMSVRAYFTVYKHNKMIKINIDSKYITDRDSDDEFDTVCYYANMLFNDFAKDDIDDDNQFVSYSIDEFMQAITKFSDIVDKLKFNRTIGEFLIEGEGDENEQEIKVMQDFFSDFKNISLGCEPCSVCNEITKTKTECKHPLCYWCWEQLIINCESSQNKCPICRECL
jgi:hypothetical protein